jgi:predicted AAA+ superfamily ATPase
MLIQRSGYIDKIKSLLAQNPVVALIFWGTHAGAEIDLFVIRGNTRLGFEFKRTVMPKANRSVYTAIADLNLSHAYIVHAGSDTYPLTDNITALSLNRISTDLKPLQ